MTDLVSGSARTVASAAFRTASQRGTAPASTLIEKNTLPSVATMSESRPLFESAEPSGVATDAKLASTSSLVTGIDAPLTVG
jgi:hypothetical protein